MEVIDMLDEREYLNKRKDYTGWNDRAEAADELVKDTAAEYARQESLEELAAWNAAAPEESKEEKEPKTMRHQSRSDTDYLLHQPNLTSMRSGCF